jgi:hypothetical protein
MGESEWTAGQPVKLQLGAKAEHKIFSHEQANQRTTRLVIFREVEIYHPLHYPLPLPLSLSPS